MAGPSDNQIADLARLADEVTSCTKCPRLVAWREACAVTPRASYRGETYRARPLPGFGDPLARTFIVGLAPAAHGGNRTGRVFTGDRSGDFLFASLHRTGFANQPTSTGMDDGLRLTDAYITAAVRCAPPENKPTPEERDNCGTYLARELEVFRTARVIIVLGAFALDALYRQLQADGLLHKGMRKPKFAHGVEYPLIPNANDEDRTLLCSYHPSQRNVFTGLLKEGALDAIFLRARALSSR